MALAAALIVLNGLFVAGEFSLVAVDRSRVERLADQGNRRASSVLRSLQRLSFELSGAQLGITATSLALGAIAEPAIARLIEPSLDRLSWLPETSTLGIALALALILATGTQMVVAELFPKNLAIARPYPSAVYFAIPMQVLNRLLRPLILFLNAAANWTVRRFGIEPREELAGVRSLEELDLMIRSSSKGGELDEEEMSILTRAIAFSERVAADAMIPRVSVDGVPHTISVAQLAKRATETGHSRFPVYEEDLDDVVGIAHVKDIYRVAAAEREKKPVIEIAKEMLVVPETQPLDDVLVDLQRRGRSMALVVDEYGGTAGVITIEDLLEEIFGEIEDEYDRMAAPSPTSTGGEGEQVLSGMLHLHEVEEATGLALPEGRYETLSGYLTARLGRFPVVGDVVRVDGFALEILSMDGHRVNQVAVRSGPAQGMDGDHQ